MPHSQISALLKAWEEHYVRVGLRETRQVPIAREDLIRLEALAEVYQLPMEEILSNLISYALREVEEKIPYRAGKKVIREEEGEPIFEDIGPMPAYLNAKKRLEKAGRNKAAQVAGGD